MPTASKARDPRAPRHAHVPLETILAAQAGDREARETVLEAFSFVPAVLARRARGNTPLEDLVSMGTIGLVQALDAYDPSRGAKFLTHAWTCVRRAIFDGLELEPLVRIPHSSVKTPEAAAWRARQRETHARFLKVVVTCDPQDQLDRDESLGWEQRAIDLLEPEDAAHLEKRIGERRPDKALHGLRGCEVKLAKIVPALAERAGSAVEFIRERLRRSGELRGNDLFRAGIHAGFTANEIRAALALLRLKGELTYSRVGFVNFYAMKEGS